ncbi:MAG: homoserine kinase [Chthoniobacterales bacterium]
MHKGIVRVRVPATTANLGPGFDCLGLALACHNIATCQVSERAAEDPFLQEVGNAFFKTSGVKEFYFTCTVAGEVPRSRGLGSSVTVRLGLLHGLNALSGEPLNANDLLALCSRLEGHPDNAVPAAFGGFAICSPNGQFIRHEVASHLRFVLLIPDFEMETHAAREVLPKEVAMADAVFSLGNTARIASAFANRDYQQLTGAFGDRLHQPWRKKLLPFMENVIAAGTEAGAYGGWLSGSGSTIACITEDYPDAVARAMKNAADISAEVLILEADNSGVRVLD